VLYTIGKQSRGQGSESLDTQTSIFYDYHAALRSKEESITKIVLERYNCCRNIVCVVILA
jgi:hypothetical protein